MGLLGSVMNSVFGKSSDSSGGAQSLLRSQRQVELGLSEKGSREAEGYMRRAYADAFRLRAASLGVGLTEYSRTLTDQNTSQGLNRTVGARMIGEQRYKGQMALGVAGAEATQGLNMDLATLSKGTANERLGIEEAFTANYINTMYHHDAVKNAERAGNIGFVSGLLSMGIAASGGKASAPSGG